MVLDCKQHVFAGGSAAAAAAAGSAAAAAAGMITFPSIYSKLQFWAFNSNLNIKDNLYNDDEMKWVQSEYTQYI